MNKYAKAAVEAARLCTHGTYLSPRVAWDQATTHIFGGGTTAQEKSCPRDAFLGLCEEGLIKGIPQGSYCNSVKNKRYALSALAQIQQNPSLSKQPKLLWEKVLKGEHKTHNSQMDVVIALWNSGLLASMAAVTQK
jgi:hypothetical protein